MPPLAPRGPKPKKRSALVEKLTPLATELLAQNPAGVTVTDLREAAVKRGLLAGTETHRQLSGLGHVFRAAGGIADGTLPSTLAVSKGVRQAVWKAGPYRPE